MSGDCIKQDLNSILQWYGFLTLLTSGDLLNFGLEVAVVALITFGGRFAFGSD